MPTHSVTGGYPGPHSPRQGEGDSPSLYFYPGLVLSVYLSPLIRSLLVYFPPYIRVPGLQGISASLTDAVWLKQRWFVGGPPRVSKSGGWPRYGLHVFMAVDGSGASTSVYIASVVDGSSASTSILVYWRQRGMT